MLEHAKTVGEIVGGIVALIVLVFLGMVVFKYGRRLYRSIRNEGKPEGDDKADSSAPTKGANGWLLWVIASLLLVNLMAVVVLSYRIMQKENVGLRDHRHQNVAIDQVKDIASRPIIADKKPEPAAGSPTLSKSPKPDECSACVAHPETEDGVRMLYKMTGEWVYFEGKCTGEPMCDKCLPAGPKLDQDAKATCHRKPD